MSRAARRHVERRGGELFVWVAPRKEGATIGWLTAATERPHGVELTPVEADGLRLFVQAGMRAVLARPVKVRLMRFPRERLEATGAVTVPEPAATREEG